MLAKFWCSEPCIECRIRALLGYGRGSSTASGWQEPSSGANLLLCGDSTSAEQLATNLWQVVRRTSVISFGGSRNLRTSLDFPNALHRQSVLSAPGLDHGMRMLNHFGSVAWRISWDKPFLGCASAVLGGRAPQGTFAGRATLVDFQFRRTIASRSQAAARAGDWQTGPPERETSLAKSTPKLLSQSPRPEHTSSICRQTASCLFFGGLQRFQLVASYWRGFCACLRVIWDAPTFAGVRDITHYKAGA